MRENFNNKNEKVVCCFCGESLLFKDAAIITIQPNFQSDEEQQLFCHKNHLVERIDKSIPLQPDFFDNDEGIE